MSTLGNCSLTLESSHFFVQPLEHHNLMHCIDVSPQNVFAVIDLYGRVESVTVTSRTMSSNMASSRPPSLPSLENSEMVEVGDLSLLPSTLHLHCVI